MNTATLKTSLSRITFIAIALSMATVCGVAHADPITDPATEITLTDTPDLTPNDELLTPNDTLQTNDLTTLEDVDLTDLNDDPILTPINDPIVIGDPIDIGGGGAVAVTPEPSSLMLLGTGLAGLSGMISRRVRKESR